MPISSAMKKNSSAGALTDGNAAESNRHRTQPGKYEHVRAPQPLDQITADGNRRDEQPSDEAHDRTRALKRVPACREEFRREAHEHDVADVVCSPDRAGQRCENPLALAEIHTEFPRRGGSLIGRITIDPPDSDEGEQRGKRRSIHYGGPAERTSYVRIDQECDSDPKRPACDQQRHGGANLR